MHSSRNLDGARAVKLHRVKERLHVQDADICGPVDDDANTASRPSAASTSAVPQSPEPDRSMTIDGILVTDLLVAYRARKAEPS
jgi:hypothetical protein